MAQYILTKKNAQVWSIDLIVAVIIFLLALVFFYKYSLNNIYAQEDNNQNLIDDGKKISDYLVSEGYPSSWSSSDVRAIGLTDGNMRLDKDKVALFYNLSFADYPRARRLMSTINDYYVYFEDNDMSRVSVNNISWIGKDYSSVKQDDMIKIIRFVFYDSEIIKMVVLVW